MRQFNVTYFSFAVNLRRANAQSAARKSPLNVNYTLTPVERLIQCWRYNKGLATRGGAARRRLRGARWLG